MRATTALCLLLPCLGACDLDLQLGDMPGPDQPEPICSTDAGTGDEPPVLTLVGPAIQSIECRTPYADPGATATDACFGDLSNSIVRTGSVNSDEPASYTLTYNVSNPAGQSATPVSRTVNVHDTAPPVLVLNGSASAVIECATSFTDPGASAMDACQGDLTAAIARTGSVNPAIPATYPLQYTVSDGTHAASAGRTVEVRDTLQPSITVQGPPSDNYECGTAYVDPGATATDTCAGDLTDAIIATKQPIPGQTNSFTIVYSVADPSGNVSTSSTPRRIAEVDTTPPVLTLRGSAIQAQECGAPFTDPGAMASDSCSGDISSSITRSGAVNSSVLASYTLTYSVSDPAGNSAPSVSRTVNVSDTLKPTLTVFGPPNIAVECGSTFTDPGAVANDQCAGSLPVVGSGSVDSNRPGNYTLSYQATDPSGYSVSATRSVAVTDTLPPTLVLNGSASAVIECATSFIDPGASAMDACQGDLTAAIARTGSVNPAIPATYPLQYTVSDGAHTASAGRTVEVRDTLQPSITVQGPLSDNYECGTAYVDPGATATDTCAGDLTGAIIATKQPIPGQPNSFTIVYSVADPSGNVSTSPTTRTVMAMDDEPPVLTLRGPAIQAQECGAPFTDPGATASDACSGDITSSIIRSGAVNNNELASYTLTYSVSDPAGNSAPPVSRTVNVSDTLKPTLTVFGPPNTAVECGDTFVDPGAVANDQCAGSLPVVRSGTVDSTMPGNYTLGYQATDPSGYSVSATRSVVVTDTRSPTIVLNGPPSIFHECGTPLPDLDAEADDQCAGPLAVVVTGAIDPNAPGAYTVVYKAMDPSGNSTPPVSRTVTVVDTLPAQIQVLPGPSIIACNGPPYVDPGATATDLCFGDLTQAIVVTSDLDQSTPGVYTISYTVTDNAGNTRVASRSITVGPCALSESSPRAAAARLAELSGLSAQLAGLTTNGTARFEAPGSLMLRGMAPGLNVFELDARTLTDATRLSVDAPAGSLVVVNLYGDPVTFTGLEQSFHGGIDPHGILFNFVEATALDLDGTRFGGTVLAPYGHIHPHRGNMGDSSPGAPQCSAAQGLWLQP